MRDLRCSENWSNIMSTKKKAGSSRKPKPMSSIGRACSKRHKKSSSSRPKKGKKKAGRNHLIPGRP